MQAAAEQAPASPLADVYTQRLVEANTLLNKVQGQVQTLKEREAIYQQRLKEANQVLATSVDGGSVEQQGQLYSQQLAEAETLLKQAYDQIAATQAQISQLKEQNGVLLQREQTYQQQITQASQLASVNANPTGQTAVSTGAPATATGVTLTRLDKKTLERQRESEKKALELQRELEKKALEHEEEDESH